MLRHDVRLLRCPLPLSPALSRLRLSRGWPNCHSVGRATPLTLARPPSGLLCARPCAHARQARSAPCACGSEASVNPCCVTTCLCMPTDVTPNWKKSAKSLSNPTPTSTNLRNELAKSAKILDPSNKNHAAEPNPQAGPHCRTLVGTAEIWQTQAPNNRSEPMLEKAMFSFGRVP